MIKDEIYIAEVINNVDTSSEGRVQIFVKELHYGVNPTLYPWARQDRPWTSDIPEIGELVYVYFLDKINFKKPYYQNKITLKNLHDHGVFDSDIKSNIDGWASISPFVKFITLSNGVTIAISSSPATPEAVIYTPLGYLYINPNGGIEIKGTSIDSLQSMVLGDNLKTWLEGHTHATPSGPSGPPDQLATLITILSKINKNN